MASLSKGKTLGDVTQLAVSQIRRIRDAPKGRCGRLASAHAPRADRIGSFVRLCADQNM